MEANQNQIRMSFCLLLLSFFLFLCLLPCCLASSASRRQALVEQASSMTPSSLHLPPSSLSPCSKPPSCLAHSRFRLPLPFPIPSFRASFKSNAKSSDTEEHHGYFGLETLQQFIQLNVGSWTGSFTQYDAQGNTLQPIPTRLVANSSGKGEQVSLYQTLKIKQAPPKTIIADEETVESDWAEFKLGETNLSTIDKRQQVGYFPSERAYTVSHQTAEMLDKVMRAGVLGEDGDDTDESPKGVKLPSRRPALVCESCLYSEEDNSRMRAFHVLDPRGLIDFIGVFQERKEDGAVPDFNDHIIQDGPQNRLDALLGCWSGHSVTRRTGIYGSTVVEEDVNVVFKLEDDGTLVQEETRRKGLEKGSKLENAYFSKNKWKGNKGQQWRKKGESSSGDGSKKNPFKCHCCGKNRHVAKFCFIKAADEKAEAEVKGEVNLRAVDKEECFF